MNKKTKLAVQEYIDNLIAKGHKDIRVSWEGGNDDGSYNIYVDGEEVPVNYDIHNGPYYLLDFIAEKSGYYNFAGDYYAKGEVIYNHDLNAFVGTDDYDELKDYDYEFKTPIKITVPKHLWFDELHVEVTGYQDDVDATVRLIINNGPVVEEHSLVEYSIKSILNKAVDEVFENIDDVNNVYVSMKTLTPQSMKTDSKGNLYAELHMVTYSKYVDENRNIEFQL